MSARQLVKNGQWCVPVEDRPKGWESWPIKIAPEVPDVRRCVCGRERRLEKRCAVRERHLRMLRRAFQSELLPTLLAWADDMGCKEYDRQAAKVFLAGVYSRDCEDVAAITHVPLRKVNVIAKRYFENGLWTYRAIVIGNQEVELGDSKTPEDIAAFQSIDLLLRTKVGTGELECR